MYEYLFIGFGIGILISILFVRFFVWPVVIDLIEKSDKEIGALYQKAIEEHSIILENVLNNKIRYLAPTTPAA